jgi:hypothetical protein
MWPHERSLVKNLEKKPFALIGVHFTRSDDNAKPGPQSFTRTQLKEVMDKEKLNWRSFMDDQGAIFRKWNVGGTPALYVIDHKGVIRHQWEGYPGAKAVDTALEKLTQEA